MVGHTMVGHTMLADHPPPPTSWKTRSWYPKIVSFPIVEFHQMLKLAFPVGYKKQEEEKEENNTTPPQGW